MHKNSYLSNLWQQNNSTGAVNQGCGFANIDLVIVLDTSTSYGIDDFNRSLQFLQILVSKSDIDSGSVRVGAVRFSTNAEIVFKLNKYSTKTEIIEAIGKIPFVHGSTNTYDALHKARTEVFTTENGDRPEINNVVLLFTDGNSNLNGRKTVPEAEFGKSEGIIIYVINVNNPYESESKAIASSPKENHYFYVETFDALEGFENRIFATICPALQLIINVNQDNYLPYIIDEAGIRLVIGVNGETLSMWTDGISVATGFKTDVALRQKSKRLTAKLSDCDDSRQFLNRHACREACIEKATQRICNCSIMEKEGGNSGLSQCFNPQEMQCSWRLRRGDVNCQCKNPCRETKYERETTSSTWPSKKYMLSSKRTAMSGVLDYSKQRDDLLMVNIYLSDLANELTEEEPAFTIENFLSNVGGTLGLWIGMSVISIGEVLELLFIICRTVCRRLLNREEREASNNLNDDGGSKENALDPCFKDFD